MGVKIGPDIREGGGGGGRGTPPIDRFVSLFAGADVNTESHAEPVIVRIFRFVMLGLLVADVILVWIGIGNWTELTLLSVGVIGLTWAMSNLSPFKTREVGENLYTRAGAMVRALAAFGAPVVAFAVVKIPQIGYRHGAGLVVALLAASTILHAIGKTLDLKAAIWNLAVCAAIAVAINTLPVPPRSSPPPKFDSDIETDVTLKFKLQTAEGKPLDADRVDITCFAILPDTWFTTRPLIRLAVASTAVMSEPEVGLPYSPLGYVIETRDEFARSGMAGFPDVEVKSVYPGESRDVVIKAANKDQTMK
jgi:hypothetical protein